MSNKKNNGKNQTKIDLTSTWETVARLDRSFNEFAKEVIGRLDRIEYKLNSAPSGPPPAENAKVPPPPRIYDPNAATSAQINKILKENIPLPEGMNVESLTKKSAWEIINSWSKQKKQ